MIKCAVTETCCCIVTACVSCVASSEAAARLARSIVTTMAQMQFKLRNIVGQGAFAVVIRCAVDSGHLAGRNLALKVLLPDANVTAERCFRSEADVLTRLTRKGAHWLVACYGLVTLPAGTKGLPKQYKGRDALAMVLEFMECGSLARMVVKHMSAPHSRPRYSKQEALQILMDIALALEAMHTESQPLLHRDLKLENVLLTRQNGRLQAKLADLGLHVCLDRNIYKPILRHRMAIASGSGVHQDTQASTVHTTSAAANTRQKERAADKQHDSCVQASSMPSTYPCIEVQTIPETEISSHNILPAFHQSTACTSAWQARHSRLNVVNTSEVQAVVTPPASAGRVHEQHTWSEALEGILTLRSLSTHWPSIDNDNNPANRSMDHSNKTLIDCLGCGWSQLPIEDQEVATDVTVEGGIVEVEKVAFAVVGTSEKNVLAQAQDSHVSAQQVCSTVFKTITESVKSQKQGTRKISLDAGSSRASLHSYNINNVLYEAHARGVGCITDVKSESSNDATVAVGVPAKHVSVQPGITEPARKQLHASSIAEGSPDNRQEATKRPSMVTPPSYEVCSTHSEIATAPESIKEPAGQTGVSTNRGCQSSELAKPQGPPMSDVKPQKGVPMSDLPAACNLRATVQPIGSSGNRDSYFLNKLVMHQPKLAVSQMLPIVSGPLPLVAARSMPRGSTDRKVLNEQHVPRNNFLRRYSMRVGTSKSASSKAGRQIGRSMLALRNNGRTRNTLDNHSAGFSINLSAIKQRLSSLKHWATTESGFIPKLLRPSNPVVARPSDGQIDSAWFFNLTADTGSCMYMAPEVFKKEPYNQSADVYSFGVVAYEVLTRSMLVFTHVGVGRVADTPDSFTKALSEGYRPARPVFMSDREWSLITSCWAADPLDRPPIQDVVKMLNTLLQECCADEVGSKQGYGCFCF